MKINQAINLAIENGYNMHGHNNESDWISHDFLCITLLDKKFWQSLGKGMGWREKGKHLIDKKKDILRCQDCGRKPHVAPPCTNLSGDWKTNWHSLIDHLASGQSVESWFESL